MLSATFIGEVQHGQLHLAQPLAEFECKQVLVTLIAPNTAVQLSGPVSEAGPKLLAALEAEILEDIGRIRATPHTSKTLAAQVGGVGRQSPRFSDDEE